jgi:hypothetical protein
MTLEVVGATSGNTGSGTSSSFATTAHADADAGDLALLRVVYGGTTITATEPTGWDVAGGVSSPLDVTNSRAYLWVRELDGGADDEPTVALSGAATGGWDMVVLRGQVAASAAAAVGEAAVSSANGGDSVLIPELDGVLAGSILVGFASQRVASGTDPASGVSAPGAYGELTDHATSRTVASQQNVRMAAYARQGTTPGTYGDAADDEFTFDGLPSGAGLSYLVEVLAAVPADDGVFPSVKLECAFTAQPGDPAQVAAATWVDLTTYIGVAGIGVKGGRQYELDRNEAGELRVALINDDGRFDPGNTASPYYPDVKPTRMVRLTCAWDGIIYYLFFGYAERWPQRWEGGGKAGRTDLVAIDGFKLLARRRLRNVYEEELALDGPVAYYPLTEPEESTSFASTMGDTQPLARLRNSKYGAGTPAAGADQVTPWIDGTALAFSGADGVNKEGSVLELARLGQGPYMDLGGTGGSVELWFAAGDVTDPGYLWTQVAKSGSGVFDNGGLKFNTDGTITVTPPSSGNTTAGAYNDGVAHHVVYAWAANGEDWTLYVDGAAALTGTLASGFISSAPYPGWNLVGGLDTPTAHQVYLGTGATVRVSRVALYDHELTAARAAAHYNAGLDGHDGELSGARAARIIGYCGLTMGARVDTGSSMVAGAELEGTYALTALQDVAVAENGVLFMDPGGLVTFKGRAARYNTTSAHTFGDEGTVGELPYDPDAVLDYDDSFLANHIEVSLADGRLAVADDADSKLDHFECTLAEQVNLSDVNDAQARAHYRLGQYKDAHLRCPRLPLHPTRDAALWPVILGAAFGDHWTVKRNPPDAAAIELEAFVESREHTIGPRSWTCAFSLSPADTKTYWQLGTAGFSELGTTTRVAY